MPTLVSIIIPTKDSAKTLDACLKSIKSQSYPNIEIIVVDNLSKDNTRRIAQKFTPYIYSKGPERSAQRNYGATKSHGKFICMIDSDMVLTPNVIQTCVNTLEKNKDLCAVIIPEKSFGIGFWATCKTLEKNIYLNTDWIEAPRMFTKKAFIKIKGYNEKMVSCEDWEITNRIKKIGKISRIKEMILHNEGALSLIGTMRKKYYYGAKMAEYSEKKLEIPISKKQYSLTKRYQLFTQNKQKLLKNPFIGIGLVFMKFAEFTSAWAGYTIYRTIKKLHEKHN